MPLIPFFVADRPASLKILSEPFINNSNISLGIMTHALISKNLIKMIRDFPYIDDNKINNDSLSKHKSKGVKVIKIADSGIFSKTGCNLSYEELFKRYQYMKVDYGIIIDFLNNSEKTIRSAIKALKIYNQNKKKYSFKLIAVIQGKNLEEYLKCYKKLIDKYEYIAIGGLLKKNPKSVRYVRIRNIGFMTEVISRINQNYSPSWLFALGCYNPSRHKLLEDLGVWGSDYKGWIFKYDRRLDTIHQINRELVKIEEKRGAVNKEILEKIETYTNKIKTYKNKKTNSVAEKRRYYNYIKEKEEVLRDLYKKMFEYRLENLRRSKEKEEYITLFNKFREILLNYTDQSWRFEQVRRYIKSEIITQVLKYD